MTWEGYFCLATVAVVFAGLASNRAPDALLMGAVVLTMLAGIVTPEEAFSGFANPEMLTVAALFVVAAGLRETGALEILGRWVFGRTRTERGALVRMSLWVTGLSAFLNNTPIVAMFIPVVTGWCRRHNVAPSRLLMPLSFLTILGGTCTLIGTSTNLVVNGMMRQAAEASPELAESLRPMGLFELSWLGLPTAVAGALFLVLFSRRLLPERRDFFAQMRDASREYLVNLEIQPGCRLSGQTVEEAGLRRLPGLFLVEIARGDQLLTPVAPTQVLAAGDVLTFTGVAATIVDLEKIPGFVPVGGGGYETGAVSRRGRVLCEAVVSGTSPCLGKTVRDSNFRAAYGAAIIAVHRGGERLGGKVGDLSLRPGDTLLLQTDPHFERVHRNDPDFLLVSGVEDSRPVRTDKTVLSAVLLALLVALMATGLLRTVTAAFLVAGLMVLTRCISASDARHGVDVQTLVTIGCAFGLGKALVNSGCVEVVARGIADHAGGFGPGAVLLGVYVFTALVTEVITNNAAAALVFPFAVGIAGQLGVAPRPFAIAVAFAASASFLTPIGYQTNLMVYAAGGYRFTDYVRLGLPLSVVLAACAQFIIPVVWPF
ncbi:MAG TPA: SLC13 family permease [Candidatus Hydrogenedentes bacterium]|nr:SLC13 family permease [Candidatus Hydrogenedentota bacterium]